MGLIVTRNHLSSRKFVLSILIFLCTCGLLVGHFIASKDFVTISKWVLILYMAGNVGGSAVSLLTNKTPTPPVN